MKKNSKKETKSIDELLEEALVPENEQPYKIPDNWVFTKLGKIVKNSKGSKPKNLYSEFQEGLIPYINIKAFETGEFQEYTDYSNRICNEDDILIVWDGARSGLVGKGVKGAVGSTLSKITTKKIDKELIFKFLKMKYEYINTNGRGIGIPHVDPDILWNIPFPLPSIKEQKRIVEKLESILGKINQAKDLIEEAKDTFKNRRASILAKAFSGELTKNWREENPNIESAEILLKKIRFNRDNFYSNKLLDSKLNNTNKPKKPDNSNFEEFEFDNKYTFPESWELINCKNLCDFITDGEHNTPQRVSEGILLLSARNVKNGFISLDKVDYIPDFEYERIIKRCNPEIGDILISCSGTIGRVARIKEDIKFTMVRSVALLKLQSNLDMSAYIEFLFQSSVIQDQILKLQKATAQANLFLGQIAKIVIPIPPREEQKEIVRIVENLLKIEDEALEKIESMEEHLELLEKSILSKAFRGELGTNNPDEESSLSLLKDILEKKENDESNKKSDNKKEVTKIMINKESIKDIISEKFISKEFTFDELRDETKNTEYDNLKEEFFDLLKSNFITQKFDENKQIMTFQVA